MTDSFTEQFRQQEAEKIALSVKFNTWSRLMIRLLIREQEARLLAGDLPVDADDDAAWDSGA